MAATPMIAFSLRVTVPIYEQVTTMAHADKRSTTWWIVRAIEEKLAREADATT